MSYRSWYVGGMNTPNPYSQQDERYHIWQQGYDECHSDFGMTWDDDPESPRSQAYDEGRAAGLSDYHGGRGYVV